MAASREGQQTTLQLIQNNVKVALNNVLNRLNSVENLDYCLYKVEWLCTFILRLGGRLEEVLLPNLLEARHLISTMNENPFDGEGNTVALIMTGNKGRPKLNIRKEWLECFLEKGFKGSDVAKMLGVSGKTVYRRLREFEIPVRTTYSSINKEELNTLIVDILHDFPNCGYKTMRGHLLSKGHKVQEERIREAMRRVDPEGNACINMVIVIVNFCRNCRAT